MSESILDTSCTDIEAYILGLRRELKRQYDRSVNKDLSQQNAEGLFKRNVTNVLRQAYDATLIEFKKPENAARGYDKNSQLLAGGLNELILTNLEGLAEELMQYALTKHRSSCALSNFPAEHNPSQAYIIEVIEETTSDWQTFSLQLKAGPAS